MITLHGKNGKYFYHETNGLIRDKGKFNTVYKGYDALYRPVLIKQLNEHLNDDPESVARFGNEFHLHVKHDNIISAHDYFIQDEKHYLIRKWIDGVDLGKKLYRFKIKEAVSMMIHVLEALEHLHQHKILHLDVQPKNILLGDDGKVYLTDLGLAQKESSINQRQPFNIYYSAPEQILNFYTLFNTTTDIYALGIMLLEMVSKNKAHHHNNPEILMNLMLAAPLSKPSQISDVLFGVIGKATSKPRFNLPPTHFDERELSEMITASQQLRYSSARHFIDALNGLSEKDLRKAWWKF